jgi:plasmid stabilization system protein ParE
LTLPIRVRPRAEADIDDAYAWYEARAVGLGEAFLRAADACMARIARDPEAHVLVHEHVRRARLRRFPYSVFYLIRKDFIDVLAVYHGRRRPRRFGP